MNTLLNPEHHFFPVSDVSLHCAIQGDGPPMIFLHGFPEFWYCWKNQIPEFSKAFRVVAPDMRGYNLSEKPAGVDRYRMRLLVEDVVGLVKALGAEKVILVGHDWGGIVAWSFALNFPEFLKALVILNAPHPALFARELANNPEQQNASQYTLLFRSGRGEEILTRNNCEFLKKLVFNGCKDPSVFTEQDREAYVEAWSQPGAITGGLNYYRASPLLETSEQGRFLVDAGGVAKVREIQVPTLVIWGEDDVALTLGLLDGLQERVREPHIKRIAGATHWVQHDAPELVNEYIWEFIK